MSSSNISGSSSDPGLNSSLASLTSDSVLPSYPPPVSQGIQNTACRELEQVDVLDSGKVVIQQFIWANRWAQRDYSTDPNRPILELPDPQGELSPKPFPSYWQRSVNHFFKELVKEGVVKKIKEQGASSEEGKELGFNMEEANRHINKILGAIVEGNPSSLNSEELEIAQLAATKTQEAWSLPSTWGLGTQDAAAWTPTQVDVTPPVNLEIATREVLGENLNVLLHSLERLTQKTLEELPKDDPKKEDVSSILRIITDAIRGLKLTLEQLQLEEAEQSATFSEMKYDQLKTQQEQLKAIQKEQRHAARLRRKANKTNKLMKILSPTIGAAIMLAAIIALPFTAGTSSFIIFAGAAIASGAMLAYTVADSEKNLTAQMIDAYNKGIDDLFPDDKWASQLVKAIIIAAAFFILTAVIVSTGGTAAASAAAASGNIASQVAVETTKQIAIQAITMFIIASNTLPDLVSSALINSGTVDKDNEEALMIIQILVMALTMVATMWLASQGSAPQEGAATVKKVEGSLDQMLKTMTQKFKEIIENVRSTGQRIANVTTQDVLKNLKAALELIVENTQNLAKYGAYEMGPQSYKDAAIGLKETLNFTHLADEQTRDWVKFSTQLQNILKTVNLGVEAGSSFTLMQIGFDLAKVLRHLAETEKAEEVIKLLIQLLQQMVDGFQTDLKSQGEWYTSLNNSLEAILQANSQSLTRSVQQYTA
ncbi:MAG: hypothetical protein ACH350_00105 [Parachlamydiaceae bacterium]